MAEQSSETQEVEGTSWSDISLPKFIELLYKTNENGPLAKVSSLQLIAEMFLQDERPLTAHQLGAYLREFGPALKDFLRQSQAFQGILEEARKQIRNTPDFANPILRMPLEATREEGEAILLDPFLPEHPVPPQTEMGLKKKDSKLPENEQ